MKTEDEVMASVLLNGGKMLSVTCEDCGAPLFEVDGKQYCVVCEELGKPGDSEEMKHNAPDNSAIEMSQVHDRKMAVNESVTESLEQALCALCKKAADASRPEDAKLFMDAVRAGTEALRELK